MKLPRYLYSIRTTVTVCDIGTIHLPNCKPFANSFSAMRKNVSEVSSTGRCEPEISACLPMAIVETEIHLSCANDKIGLAAQHCPLQKESATARVPLGRAGRGQAARKPLQPKPVGI